MALAEPGCVSHWWHRVRVMLPLAALQPFPWSQTHFGEAQTWPVYQGRREPTAQNWIQQAEELAEHFPKPPRGLRGEDQLMPSLWLDGDGHRVGISRPKVQGISSVFSFMYSLIGQIYMAHLLCTTYSCRFWGYKNKSRLKKKTASWGIFQWGIKTRSMGDFPGSPVVKISPFNAEVWV